MKPPLPRTLSAVPRTLHVQIEIAKAIHTLFGQDEQHQRLAESATINNTYWEIGQELRLACRQWLLAHSQPHVIDSNAAKAAVDDPKHPGWPAKTPDGKGGQFRPKDGQTVVAANEPGIGHNQGPPLEAPPKIPPRPPATPQALNNFIKAAAYWLAAAGKAAAARYLRLLQGLYWLTQGLQYINAYLSPPKTFKELQQDALNPQVGYDIHHVVEQTPARNDGYPEDMINGPDNLVRISTLKHWQINGWYGERNEKYDYLSPREYLRGKSWEERMRVGKDALTLFEVLKP